MGGYGTPAPLQLSRPMPKGKASWAGQETGAKRHDALSYLLVLF